MRLLFFIATLGILFSPQNTLAQSSESIPDRYFKGSVLEIKTPQEAVPAYGMAESLVPVTIELQEPDGTTRIVEGVYNDLPDLTSDDLSIGERVVILETELYPGEISYVITDRYRLPSLLILGLLFIATATACAGRRGLSAVLGLALSMSVILFYLVPRIAAGHDPFITAAISVFTIACLSLTIAHGFSRHTGIALISTLTTLALSLGLAQLFVRSAHLLGMGREDAFYLQFSNMGSIDLRGLLLAGIVIGVLGVLDDVTTAQTAAVREIADAGAVRSFHNLFVRGLGVGKEHVVSLVNTLALAYAGVSLPLLLIFSQNDGSLPLWMLINGEMVSEELIRTLVGSTALTLAVPISTAIAAWYYSRHQS